MKGNIIGEEVLELSPGSMVKVTGHLTDDNDSDIGCTLLRVNSYMHPLVNIGDGDLWGSNVEGYIFKELQNIKRK